MRGAALLEEVINIKNECWFYVFSFTSLIEIVFGFLPSNKKRDTLLLKGRVFMHYINYSKLHALRVVI